MVDPWRGEHLRGAQIGAGIHYPAPVHLQPAYAGRLGEFPAGLPETTRVVREILSLPIYPQLTEPAVQRQDQCFRREREARFEPLGKNVAEVFDPDAAAGLRAVHDRERETGDLLLDFDPICACQDAGGIRTTIADIQVVKPDAATAKVDLRWLCSAPPDALIPAPERQRMAADCRRAHNGDVIDAKRMLFEIVLLNGQWRLHDIHSPEMPSLKGLLAALLRPDRSAASTPRSPGPSTNPPSSAKQDGEDAELQALIAAATEQHDAALLKKFLVSHPTSGKREQITQAYVQLSAHRRSHAFGIVDTLKIYARPDIGSAVVREDRVGKEYVVRREEGEFVGVEYDIEKYGYIYKGFLN